jgi:tetratricopeptide (TPR) repeat protein
MDMTLPVKIWFPAAFFLLFASVTSAYPCTPLRASVHHTELVADEDIDNAPVRISADYSRIDARATFGEFCSDVDLYVAFVSSSGHIYFVDGRGRLTDEACVYKTATRGGFSENFDNNGHMLPFGEWQVYWLVMPSGGDFSAYELFSYRKNIENPEQIVIDDACPVTAPEYAVDPERVADILVTGAEAVKAMVDARDQRIVMQAVSSYAEGSGRLSFRNGISGDPELVISSRAAAYYVAGIEAFVQNSKLVALWCFLEAAKRDIANAAYLNNVAFVLLQYESEEVYDLARTILMYARTISPNYNPLNVNLGYVSSWLGRYDEAAYYYQTAWFKDMGNADYLDLVREAYESLECGGQGAEFFTMLAGNMDGTGVHDDGGEVSSGADDDADPETSDSGGGSGNSHTDAYYEVRRQARDLAREMEDRLKNDIGEIVDPAMAAFFSAMGQCPMDCAASSPDTCQFEKCVTVCLAAPSLGLYRSSISALGLVYSGSRSLAARIDVLIDSYASELRQDEYDDLHEWVQGIRRNANEQYASILSGMPTDTAISSHIERINSMGCELSGGEEMLLRSFGGVTVSLEPSACYVIICVSMDNTGMGAVQVSFGIVSGKFGSNPFNGDTLLQFGIGPGEVGVGSVTLEGSLYLKIEGNGHQFERIGFQPTIGAGPLEAGYYFGLERVD